MSVVTTCVSSFGEVPLGYSWDEALVPSQIQVCRRLTLLTETVVELDLTFYSCCLAIRAS